MSDFSARSPYLDGLPAQVREVLAAANQAGLDELSRRFDDGTAVAFLGAGVSTPIYPLWPELMEQMIMLAMNEGLTDETADTCRHAASNAPEFVADTIARRLNPERYQQIKYELLRPRRDKHTDLTYTPMHELVCRCPFGALVTTNYDSGIVDARSIVRPTVPVGFTSWREEGKLDGWASGDVLDTHRLPVLYAHGCHVRGDTVLSSTEYRMAYRDGSKLPHVLSQMMGSGHLVWIGFSFADWRVASTLERVAANGGTAARPGMDPRHVALMGWDPDGNWDIETLADLARVRSAAMAVLYPTPGGKHDALRLLLEEFTRPIPEPTVHRSKDRVEVAADRLPQVGPVIQARASRAWHWRHGSDDTRGFVGRVDELKTLQRWAADPTVRVVGVTAWAGAGKTALVSRWLEHPDRVGRAAFGLFAWNFNADRSGENWAHAVIAWASEVHQRYYGTGSLAARVLKLMAELPVVLVLDGLEVLQEGPSSDGWGLLRDNTLRDVIIGAVEQAHPSLLVLTSRFPFADVAEAAGNTAQILDVPPLTVEDGAALLALQGAEKLSELERRDIVRALDGHALAVRTAAVAIQVDPAVDVPHLLRTLVGAATQGDRVEAINDFYADLLDDAQRFIVGAVSTIAAPCTPADVLAMAEGSELAGWDEHRIQVAVTTGPLRGLVSWRDGRISAHALMKTFRRYAPGAADAALRLTLSDAPSTAVTSREEAETVVRAIEIAAGGRRWERADQLYRDRAAENRAWLRLPAVRLGQQAAESFVGGGRREDCEQSLGGERVGYYLCEATLYATLTGDLVKARGYVEHIGRYVRGRRRGLALSIASRNRVTLQVYTGELSAAKQSANEALERARESHDDVHIIDALACVAWVADVTGESMLADQQFLAADLIEGEIDRDADHLYSVDGLRWASFLHRTGRADAALELTRANLEVGLRYGWTQDVARCRVLLASMGIAAGESVDITGLLDAVSLFRDGGCNVDLVDALVVAGEEALSQGDLEAADRYLDEALDVAVRRAVVPLVAAALNTRAAIATERARNKGTDEAVRTARERADAALMRSTSPALRWHELAALRTHAHLDVLEDNNRGYAQRARTLEAKLTPMGIRPDPLERGSVAERLADVGASADRH
jgi:hypothetical protein